MLQSKIKTIHTTINTFLQGRYWTEKKPNQDPEHTEEKLDEISDWLEYCSLKRYLAQKTRVGCKECLHNNRDHFQDLL
jgi:hypothetical protein